MSAFFNEREISPIAKQNSPNYFASNQTNEIY